jgi:glutamine amidotransferase PdxT
MKFILKNNRSFKILLFVGIGVAGKGPKLIEDLLISKKMNVIVSKYFPRNYENIDLLIIPGGSCVKIFKNLKRTEKLRIIDYVKNGGSYLGICAGAYLGSYKFNFN